MYIPEYSITPKILKNIASIEYARAVIENTSILPTWALQLQREALTSTVINLLHLEGVNADTEVVKSHIDGLINSDNQNSLIRQATTLLNKVSELSISTNIDEEVIKKHFFDATKKQSFRKNSVSGKVNSQEILAEIVELFDWINSVDAIQTHPLIVGAIVMGRLEEIYPFDELSSWFSNFSTLVYLKTCTYTLRDFLIFGDFDYIPTTTSIAQTEEKDMTQWIENFTQNLLNKAEQVKAHVFMFANDATLSKATGQARLDSREQKIVLYIQDYGLLQNSDFGKLFPDLSQDTVLRTLKRLIDRDIIVKKGSTKSSRYELA